MVEDRSGGSRAERDVEQDVTRTRMSTEHAPSLHDAPDLLVTGPHEAELCRHSPHAPIRFRDRSRRRIESLGGCYETGVDPRGEGEHVSKNGRLARTSGARNETREAK